MIQNAENVKYVVYFTPEDKETADVEAILTTMGVSIKTYSIEQDDEFFIANVIALYAWKLAILDRLFGSGAQKISIERLSA
jgi:hypothetical protein